MWKQTFTDLSGKKEAEEAFNQQETKTQNKNFKILREKNVYFAS